MNFDISIQGEPSKDKGRSYDIPIDEKIPVSVKSSGFKINDSGIVPEANEEKGDDYKIILNEESSRDVEEALKMVIENGEVITKDEGKVIYEILTHNSSPDEHSEHGIIINDDGSCSPTFKTRVELIGDLLRVTFTDGSIREVVLSSLTNIVENLDLSEHLSSSDNSITIEAGGDIKVNTEGWGLELEFRDKINILTDFSL